MNQYKHMYRYSILGEANHRHTNDSDLSDSQEVQNRPRVSTFTQAPIHSSTGQMKKMQTNCNLINISQITNSQCGSDKCKQLQTIEYNKENQQRFYTKIYNHKIAKLNTAITAKQKERYMHKLTQTVDQGQLKAIGFQFDVECIKEISQFIITSRIIKVVLDKNPLCDQGVIKLSQSFGKMAIQELSLMSVGISNKSAAILFKNMRFMLTLKKLNLSSIEGTFRNKITSEGIQPLKYFLNQPKCILDTLLLDSISLGCEGIKIAFQGIQSPPLQCLSLSKNQLGSKNLNIFTANIANTPLLKLDLSKNNLGDSGMKHISQILGLSYGKNTVSMTVVELNLSSNSISSYGFQYFCRQMGVNQTLQLLVLDDNPLGEGERFFNIKYYLNKNWGLKKLRLVNINPSDKDIKFLCQGLEVNRSLQQLILSKNQVDGQILSSIFGMLGKNKSLRQLDLSHCKMSDGYILKNEYLISTGTFGGVEEMDMQNNYINNKGVEVLKKMIFNNKNILKLNLARNCAGERVLVEISQILKDNQSKRPFEHQLNYFQSVSDLYEEKKRALKYQVQKMKNIEQTLKTTQLAEEISIRQARQQHIFRQINKQNKVIAHLLSGPLHPLIIEQSQSQDSYFITDPQFH